MAGIYIHVPFCYSRCSYCDFYKSTSFDLKKNYIDALCQEIERSAFFNQFSKIDTLYFGGGTPSVLSVSDFERILAALTQKMNLSSLQEFTMEMNPDDIRADYVDALMSHGVNRVSMGIQSFEDKHLRLMNRRHSASQAIQAIEILKQAGLQNVSADLIYGLPFMTFNEWQSNVEQMLRLDLQHISAYHLTIEKNTAFYDYLKKGKIQEINEDESVKQFRFLQETLTQHGFVDYEISNFAKPGFYSQHNSSYWKGLPYLGLGPSAHSFYNDCRFWNVADLSKYIHGVTHDEVYQEKEVLSSIDRYNEIIMVGLRTKVGFLLSDLEKYFDGALLEYFHQVVHKQIKKKHLLFEDGRYFIPDDKRFITDGIIAELFYVED